MRPLLTSIFAPSRHDSRDVATINQLRTEYERLSDDELNQRGACATDLLPLIAVTAVIAERVLGERMFDVQLRGALRLDAREYRRDANRRRQNVNRGSGDCMVGPNHRRCACHDCKR